MVHGEPLQLKDLNYYSGIIVGAKPYSTPYRTRQYRSTNWFQALFESNVENNPYSFDEIGKVFCSKYGNREIQIPDEIIDDEYTDIPIGYYSAVSEYLADEVDSLYIQNWRKYESYWNALIDKEYNPIWNVDGTEIRGYTKKNTGTQGNTNTKTGNITDNKTITYNGSEQVSNGGTDTTVESGSITDTKSGTKTNSRNGQRSITNSGTDTTTKSGNETRSTVPMESGTFYDTEKTTYNNVADGTTYGKTETETYTNLNDIESFNNYTDTQTFNNHQNQRTLNTTETKSFTNRNDTDNTTTTFNNVQDSGTRTDNLKEEYNETLTRQGNIGVTKSQDLIESEMLLRAKYDFMAIVLSDIASYILYMN